MKKFAVLSLLMLSFSLPVLAGGSVSRQDVFEEVCDESQSLCAALDALKLEPTGEGVRLGRQFGERAGERVMPFTFQAHPREGASVTVTIDRDQDGKIRVTIQ